LRPNGRAARKLIVDLPGREEIERAQFELEYAKLQHECHRYGRRVPPSREYVLDVAKKRHLDPITAVVDVRARRKW
jgi:hypothetical protein